MKKTEDNSDAVDSQTGVWEREGKKGRIDKLKIWFKKLGLIGFFFFLIKGLLWLIIPYLIADGIFDW